MHKSNRRGFFGLLGAAAVAPAVAKEIAKAEPAPTTPPLILGPPMDLNGNYARYPLNGGPYERGSTFSLRPSNCCIVANVNPLDHTQIVINRRNGNDNA